MFHRKRPVPNPPLLQLNNHHIEFKSSVEDLRVRSLRAMSAILRLHPTSLGEGAEKPHLHSTDLWLEARLTMDANSMVLPATQF